MKETFNNGERIFLAETVLVLGILSEDELQKIIHVGKLPTAEEMQTFCALPVVREIYMECGWDTALRRSRLAELAQKYLAHNSAEMALRAVVLAGRF